MVIVSPHGGGIELGTSEVALAIAGINLSYYLFEGVKTQDNGDLHITSSNFDEPQCLEILRESEMALTVHGESSDTEAVYLGGLNNAATESLRAALELQGFTVLKHPNMALQGLHPQNICNLGRGGAGVQLELSRGLRESFFDGFSKEGRQKSTHRLVTFSLLIRQALAGMV